MSPFVCLTFPPALYVRTQSVTNAREHTRTSPNALVFCRVIQGCGTLGLKEGEQKKHLCICLCSWSPARGLLGFSEVCCDLTRPVTGGTVNIRLSCDSLRGLEEPTKGQCFLMPLPTTKLCDFIFCSCICPIFRGWIHWRCCVTLLAHCDDHSHSYKHPYILTHKHTALLHKPMCQSRDTDIPTHRHILRTHNLWVRLRTCHVWQWQWRINASAQLL